MKVLVLGGSGYIGSRLCSLLKADSRFEPVSASSRARASEVPHLQLDTCDHAALTAALQGVDAVVNCVAGGARAIAEGSRVLAASAAAAGCNRIVHLSTMSVYGPQEGDLDEQAPLSPRLGWYGRAKCEAEAQIAAYVRTGRGCAVVLRPGCVWGPQSELWVGRVGRWLHAGRLGDLGIAGDGWSNLVHLDDVCTAIIAALRLPLQPGSLHTYNLAAPDSPRWNEYFTDLALAIGATPVPRLVSARLLLDAWLLGPPLHLLGKAAKRRMVRLAVPDPISPGLLGLWRRHLRLDASAAARDLALVWTPYADTLQDAASWFLRQESRSVAEAPLVTSVGAKL